MVSELYVPVIIVSDKKWPVTKGFTRAKYAWTFLGGDELKKAKNAAKNNMIPDPSALEGIPTHNPHEEFAKKDAIFKKRRGAQR